MFTPSRTESATWRLRIVSSAFVCSLLFAGFASAMTLEMTLAANNDVVRLRRETRSGNTWRLHTSNVNRVGQLAGCDVPNMGSPSGPADLRALARSLRGHERLPTIGG